MDEDEARLICAGRLLQGRQRGWRPEGLEAGAVVGNDMGGGDSSVGGSSRVSSGFGGALVRAGVPAG